MGSHTRTMSLYCFFVLFGSLHIILAADSEKSVTKCTDQLSGKTYPVGSEWKNPGQCTKSICKREGGGVTIQTKGCPTLQTQSDCKIVKNSKSPTLAAAQNRNVEGKIKRGTESRRKKIRKKKEKENPVVEHMGSDYARAPGGYNIQQKNTVGSDYSQMKPQMDPHEWDYLPEEATKLIQTKIKDGRKYYNVMKDDDMGLPDSV